MSNTTPVERLRAGLLSATLCLAASAAEANPAQEITRVNRSADSGTSLSSALDARQQAMVPIAALAVVQERKQRGIEDVPGRAPQRAIPVGDERLAAGTSSSSLSRPA